MKRVLVVDDSPTIREAVGLALTGGGYQVVEAGDGADGLRQLETQAVSLVICDVTMPGMSGLEMVEAVLAKPQNQGLPILMLTSEGQPQLIERAKRAGARGWIVKPFKAELLVATVTKLIGV